MNEKNLAPFRNEPFTDFTEPENKRSSTLR